MDGSWTYPLLIPGLRDGSTTCTPSMLLYELDGRRLAGVLLLELGAMLDEREQSVGIVSVRDRPGTS